MDFLNSVMRGGDLSLRPPGLEAKQCAQRAVGDRGADSNAALPDGVDQDGNPVMREKPANGAVHGGLSPRVGEDGTMENGNMEKRAMVGHLKAD